MEEYKKYEDFKHSSIKSFNKIKYQNQDNFPYFAYFLSKMMFGKEKEYLNDKRLIIEKLKEKLENYLEEKFELTNQYEEMIELGK